MKKPDSRKKIGFIHNNRRYKLKKDKKVSWEPAKTINQSDSQNLLIRVVQNSISTGMLRF